MRAVEFAHINQISSYFEEVITSSESYVLVRIDMSRVEKLMLEINMDQIRNAIISAPKLKLKSMVCRYFVCHDSDTA